MPLIEKLLNLIYPQTCGFCNKICKESLCNKCNLHLKKYQIDKIENLKKDKKIYFDEFLTIFKYEGLVREKIIEYKFNDKPYLNRTFTTVILKNKKIYDSLKEYDIIIPVPIHKKRKHKRGYNQTELIAKNLSKSLKDLIFNSNVLIKQKNTKPQSSLNKTDRVKNVKNAFAIKNELYLKNKNIILLDDIYTTGSTINECSKILKKAGAKRILILTLAKD